MTNDHKPREIFRCNPSIAYIAMVTAAEEAEHKYLMSHGLPTKPLTYEYYR